RCAAPLGGDRPANAAHAAASVGSATKEKPPGGPGGFGGKETRGLSNLLRLGDRGRGGGDVGFRDLGRLLCDLVEAVVRGVRGGDRRLHRGDGDIRTGGGRFRPPADPPQWRAV